MPNGLPVGRQGLAGGGADVLGAAVDVGALLDLCCQRSRPTVSFCVSSVPCGEHYAGCAAGPGASRSFAALVLYGQVQGVRVMRARRAPSCSRRLAISAQGATRHRARSSKVCQVSSSTFTLNILLAICPYLLNQTPRPQQLGQVIGPHAHHAGQANCHILERIQLYPPFQQPFYQHSVRPTERHIQDRRCCPGTQIIQHSQALLLQGLNNGLLLTHP